MVDFVNTFLQGLSHPIVLWLIQQKPKHIHKLKTEINWLTSRKLEPSILYHLLYWFKSKGCVMGEWMEDGQRNLRRHSITVEVNMLLCKISALLNRPPKHVLINLPSDSASRNACGL